MVRAPLTLFNFLPMVSSLSLLVTKRVSRRRNENYSSPRTQITRGHLVYGEFLENKAQTQKALLDFAKRSGC